MRHDEDHRDVRASRGALAAEQRARSALDALNEGIPALRSQVGLTGEAVLSNRKRLEKRASASDELRATAREEREAARRRADLDPLNRTVQVRRTVQRIKGEGWVATAPKTKRSARKVPILATDLLMDMRKFLDQHPNRANPDAMLWPGRKPGTHVVDFSRRLDPTNFLRHHFRPTLEKHGLAANFRNHDLRHTAASLWLAAGIEPFKVSRWLGHSNIAVTDAIYSHLYPSDYVAERAAFDRAGETKPKVLGPKRRSAR